MTQTSSLFAGLSEPHEVVSRLIVATILGSSDYAPTNSATPVSLSTQPSTRWTTRLP